MRRIAFFLAIAAGALALPAANAAAACTTTVSTPTAITNASVAAKPGETVCVANGSYGDILIGGAHAGTIYMEPAPGATVTMTSLTFSTTATNFDVKGFKITSLLEFDNDGGEFLRVSEMDINRILIRGGVYDVTIERNLIRGDDGNAIAVGGTGTTNSTEARRITIHRNEFDTPMTDGVYSSFHEDLTITQNEFYGLDEIGHHSDVYQSSNGGTGLVFSQNYAHDFEGQGVFIKDGTVSDVEITDNLIVRDLGANAGSPISLYETKDALIANNTVWGNKEGTVLRGLVNANLTVEQNVFEYFLPTDDDDVDDGDKSNTWWDTTNKQQFAARIAEDCNVIGGGWAWSESGRNGVNDALYVPDDGDTVPEPGEREYWAAANFPAPTLLGGDDWVVSTTLCGDPVGVTWQPGDWPVGL